MKLEALTHGALPSPRARLAAIAWANSSSSMRAMRITRQRRTEGPVARGQELVIDEIADHLELAAAQEVGRHEIADREHEDEDRTRRDARRRQRQSDARRRS